MKYFEMRLADNGVAEIELFGEIKPFAFMDGDKSAQMFIKELRDLGPNIREIILNVNSPGGSVWEGSAIFNTLKYHPAKVTANIIAVAASIASVIVMAADKINIAPNAAIMIHEPYSGMSGTASEMRKQADLLDSIKATVVEAYTSRTGLEAKEIRDMLAAETWLFAEDAVAKGFADAVMEVEDSEDPFSMYADQGSEVLMRYTNLPDSLKAMVEAAHPGDDETVVASGDGSAPAPAASGSPATDPAPTADKEKILIMDKATLMSEHSDVANELVEEARTTERARVSEIRNAALPGYDELVNTSIENGASLTDFLVAQNKAEQGRIQAKHEAQVTDETVGPKIEDADAEKAERPRLDNKFKSDVYARMNAK